MVDFKSADILPILNIVLAILQRIGNSPDNAADLEALRLRVVALKDYEQSIADGGPIGGGIKLPTTQPELKK